MDKVIVLASQIDKHLGLFKDLEKNDISIMHYVDLKNTGNITGFIRRIHLSSRLFWGTTRPPFRYIWYNYGNKLSLNNVKAIIVSASCIDQISLSYLKKCQLKGIKIILLLLDSIQADSLVVRRNRNRFFLKLWDRVVTFDPKDAEYYGFTYKGFCCYSKQSIKLSNIPEYDVYFTGTTKGNRSKMINETYQYFSSCGLKCMYDVQLRDKSVGKSPGINYIKRWIKYEDILIKLANSKCVLEIVQSNQNGPSLRYFESIFYNKKLITNNNRIVNYPYYNPQWMKIIEKPEDIDVEWVKNSEIVDYHYNGEFSPIHFVKYILSL